MKARKMVRTRRLGFEGLESRAMLASVSFSGGILSINGNDTAETVTVAEVTPGTVTVTGTGIATPVTRSGVIGIVANMRGGVDTINIGTAGNSVDLRGSVSILLGNGADVSNLFINTPAAVTVDGGVQAGTFAQNEIITVRNSNIGTFVANTFAGDDFLNVQASNFVALVANLGVGSLTAGQIDSDAFLMGGGGALSAAINLGTVQAGNQNNLQIGGGAFGTLSIVGGQGRDFLLLGNLQVSNVLAINTLGGNDSITLNTVAANNSLSIATGAGIDDLTLIAVITATAVLDGGPGIDTITDDASPNIGQRLKFNWEIDDAVL